MKRLLCLLSTLCLSIPASGADTSFKLTREFPNLKLERPITVVTPADGTGRMFLAQQTGKILLLPKDLAGAGTKVFLDVTGLMKAENDFEEGLVGLAFHPKYKENGRFYVCYAQQAPKINRLSEFRVSASDPDKADAASERVLLEVPRPFWNHNSGNLLFGPDGMLYFSVGDGGKGKDAAGLSQVQFTMNGKLLRIDVDGRTGRRQYGIPQDNPFVKVDGACPEAWAWGLRNPWGIAFDESGALWLADVGQEQREEINVIVKGGNYGWSFREGTVPLNPRQIDLPKDVKFLEPVHDYDRSQGTSITGGFVYRGTALPDLKGAYVYGDWGNGKIWALRTEGPEHKKTANTLLLEPEDLKKPFAKPTGFCEDLDREILVLDWNGGIFRLEKR